MEKIYTPYAPQAIGPYSQAIKTDGFLFTSGQIPINPEDGSIVEGDIRVQTERVMKNLSAVLLAAGTDFDHVVKTTCFLADMNDFADFNAVYGQYITNAPARSCVGVQQLPKNVKVEVELIVRL